MSEQDKKEDFLARWSRRKRDVAEAGQAEEKSAAAPEASRSAEAEKSGPPSAPTFDVTKLPSIESIGPDTDIRGFLQPGVPAELRAAALRRAWVADPAIRDFAGLQEYDFVFNSPETFGMGELPAGTDVVRLLTEVFGKQSAPEEPKRGKEIASNAEAHVRLAENSPVERREPEPAVSAGQSASPETSDRGEQNVAEQQKDPERPAGKPKRHGGALPRS